MCVIAPLTLGPGPGRPAACPSSLPQVDHAAAVKEYSRSSADQEEPLPHELRPSAVLSRTMDYLVTQIMDQKEGSLRDWYDFLWNRTRGIRKVRAALEQVTGNTGNSRPKGEVWSFASVTFHL